MAEQIGERTRVVTNAAYDLGASTFESLGERLKTVCEDSASADGLVKAIETEVLPRLMLVHQSREFEAFERKPNIDFATPEHIDEFVDVLVKGSAHAAGEIVDALIATDIPVEDVFLGLMAPTARRLGEMWEEDTCDFADVTIGLCRLHELLRHNSIVGDDIFRGAGAERPSILLGTACGDQHVFGLMMVSEFFRRDEWLVWTEPGASVRELSRIAADQSFDFIGLSLATSMNPSDVKKEIARLRGASANQNVKILIGGALLSREENIHIQVGADGYAVDAAKAPAFARDLLAKARIGC